VEGDTPRCDLVNRPTTRGVGGRRLMDATSKVGAITAGWPEANERADAARISVGSRMQEAIMMSLHLLLPPE